jgi:hypothetical protein
MFGNIVAAMMAAILLTSAGLALAQTNYKPRLRRDHFVRESPTTTYASYEDESGLLDTSDSNRSAPNCTLANNDGTTR